MGGLRPAHPGRHLLRALTSKSRDEEVYSIAPGVLERRKAEWLGLTPAAKPPSPADGKNSRHGAKLFVVAPEPTGTGRQWTKWIQRLRLLLSGITLEDNHDWCDPSQMSVLGLGQAPPIVTPEIAADRPTSTAIWISRIAQVRRNCREHLSTAWRWAGRTALVGAKRFYGFGPVVARNCSPFVSVLATRVRAMFVIAANQSTPTESASRLAPGVEKKKDVPHHVSVWKVRPQHFWVLLNNLKRQ